MELSSIYAFVLSAFTHKYICEVHPRWMQPSLIYLHFCVISQCINLPPSIYFDKLIHSAIYGHLGSFEALTLAGSALMNTAAPVFGKHLVWYTSIHPRVELLGHWYIAHIFSFYWIITICQSTNLYSHLQCVKFLFSTSSSILKILPS